MSILLLSGRPQRINPREDITVLNPSTTETVNVGDTSSPDTPIPPQGAFILGGNRSYWLSTASGNVASVDLLRGLQGSIPSPAQIAAQLTQSGLATAIAADMIAAGVAKDSSVNAPAFGPAKDSTLTTVNTTLGTPAQTADVTGVAGQLKTGGLPLLIGAASLANLSGQMVNAATTTTLGPYSISKSAYSVGVTASIPATATSPFLRVIMQWSDTTSGLIVAQEAWYLSCGSAANKVYTGVGPTKGDTLTVFVHNMDAAQGITYSFSFTQNSRTFLDDSWRCYDSVNVPGFTLPGMFPDTGILAESSISVNASTTVDRLMNLYYGTIQFMATLSATGTATLALKMRGPVSTFDQIYNAGIGGQLNTGPILVSVPRGPVLIEFTNNGASAVTFNIFVDIVAKGNN